MNWSRAKSILILLFLVGNIILGYQLWTDRRGVNAVGYVIGGDFDVTLEDRLDEHGIALETAVPESTPRMYSLRLAPASIDLDSMRSALFGDAEVTAIPAEGSVAGYQADTGVLVRGGPGAVRYRSHEEEPVGPLDQARARDTVDSFLEPPALRPANMVYDYTRFAPDGDRAHVYYRQEYEEYPIFGGGGMVIVTELGVEEYQHIWFDVRGPVGTLQQILPAERAITVNLPRVADLGGEEALVEILLGYYAGMADAPEWEVHPVWRLRFEDGTVIIVNALTGAVKWPL